MAKYMYAKRGLSDEELLGEVRAISQLIISTYLRGMDEVALRIAGCEILGVDHTTNEDLAPLWTYGSMPEGPPEGHRTAEEEPEHALYASLAEEGSSTMQEEDANEAYWAYITGIVDSVRAALYSGPPRYKAKPLVQQYRVSAHVYAIRHPDYLPSFRRIPSDILENWVSE
ncbi:hypothetical protein SYNPS1DRAFT_30415 [Syncephalis pseudoplumigaleata]|uniref:Uncharacterized protein n=1 Tax=Syncephalis pseudoplumigaleata TaxID=1712513 RepID=A0A4P9YUV6_9FUNG|nr:hypothetical protein SYNPS1DRAFT_30415 [Syncephalis pseudoplumigaleata]|eukprot:RKP23823.1 hypothetical protein SYNPS1DRAFT_30415 [Syncephalis pseudoplumigaleata]